MADNSNEERNFHHPYEPYDIQKQFMNAVYDCLEEGKVGIFESPTGTGKSLSLICGSLTWLRDQKRRTFEEGFAVDEEDRDEPAWILDHARRRKKEAALYRRRELEERLKKIKAREEKVKEKFGNGEPWAKRVKVGVGRGQDGDEDEDAEARFVLDDYESDEEARNGGGKSKFNEAGVSAETQAMLEELGMTLKDAKSNVEEEPDETKIFFCSRTHSQLTQFSGELNRINMPPALTLDEPSRGSEEDDSLVEDVKYLTLGSRKNLCINPDVSKLGSATAINERCLELQEPGTGASRKCKFMPNRETQVLVNEFRDHAIAKIRDIEDLGNLGKKIGICPYYAARPATKRCEIVTLPYPLLLQKSARDAMGISPKGHIVIIDEAHNLMDAIVGINSMSVTLDQVQQARAQLLVYLRKFDKKLKGKNRVYIAQTVRILDSIIGALGQKMSDPKATEGAILQTSLLAGKGVDQINIFGLDAYLKESRLARKVDGYITYQEQSQSKAKTPAGGSKAESKHAPRETVPVLSLVQSFLLCLMNPSDEGRFFYSKDDSSSITLRYLLLDPTYHFRDVVEDARAVILAGGTMSPMSDYEQHLLSYLQPSKIMTLSCGHVIPPSNLLAIPVVQSLGGRDFNFTFESRQTDKTMIDLGVALISAAQHIPDGVVVFFPSYSYLDACMAAWKRLRVGDTQARRPTPHAKAATESLDHPLLLSALTECKPIFVEQRSQQQQSRDNNANPRSKEAAADSVLDAYSAAVGSGGGRGALLFAVIGGTLSEGINFSDALGRGVIVVGLPFPNPNTAEMKAKMQYISTKAASTAARGQQQQQPPPPPQDGKAAAREYYENVCMRSVNQCVGRAIRHRGDYAAILLLDKRYSGQRIQAKLPRWIRASLLANGAGVRDVETRLDEFFAGKKQSC